MVRNTVRWAVLVCAIAFAWPGRRYPSTSLVLPALSPFTAIGSTLSHRIVGAVALFAVPMLLLMLIWPRCFCRFGCPTGLLQELCERLRAGPPRAGARFPDLGRWLALATFGGALVGYPLFLWLDPLAIFHGFLNAWRFPAAFSSVVAGLGLPLLLLLAVARPRLWCRRICPLGATQDLLSWPQRAIRAKRRRPEDAVEEVPQRPSAGRRWFLAVGAGAAGALAMRWVRGQPAPLRPPGSRDEAHFNGVCVRCGNCAQVCPAHIIRPQLDSLHGFLTPRLCFERDYCREDCNRCNDVCPTSAIGRLSLSQKRQTVIGRAEVNLDLCLLMKGGECTACIRQCPYQAIELRSADGGFSNWPGVVSDRCNGCGACEAACPTRPECAVQVRVVARHT